ncbi:hypothetical protein [Cellulomonas shaoxiangyii]|uniref:Uncharacterized protein n=1 Tax=Cellulomonas shaoxiangyii TaxID=2566013 RepID=A0A4V1CN04_9CELL|nr:hypothetical protein [Cellulomonas shaoxiangyii]QCB94755.1 hypothetical protein E5225_15515 [Cellulomonas shaoxiangyii]TGY86485.1 hypothetical protein E5226_01540 [Cellulomonas shaoxiangyii]
MSPLSVSCTNSSRYTPVLYLRDLLDPSALDAFPPLTPAVAPLPVDQVPAGAWEQWVADIEGNLRAPEMVEPRSPRLAEAVAQHRLEAEDWANEHIDDSVVRRYQPEWMSAFLASTGGASGTFTCEVLPVRGVWWRDLSPRRMLVSQIAFADHDLVDRLFKERIAALLD